MSWLLAPTCLTSTPSRRSSGFAPVSPATCATTLGEVAAAANAATNWLAAWVPENCCAATPPTSAGAATYAVTAYFCGVSSTTAVATTAASTGSPIRIRSRSPATRR